MKIGIEARVLTGQRTGVANYTLNMLSALSTIASDIEFYRASPLGWKKIFRSEFSTQLSNGRLDKKRSALAERATHRLKRFDSLRAAHRIFQKATLQSVYKSRSISLFHAFNYVPPAEPVVPILPVVYDLSFVRYPEMHPAERLRRLSGLQKYLENAPTIQTISFFSKREIADVYGLSESRIFVAYPAAASYFKPLGREATQQDIAHLDLKPGRYFLAVGTLEPRKNLRTLVSAYSQLSHQEREVLPLVIVGGEGWGKTDLPHTTDALIREGSIRFLGYTPDLLLRSLYEGARLMLYPSIYEGFGMPVIEAMACGTQVVHSIGTSMDEITDKSSRKLPPLDVDAWTECLRVAAHDSSADSASREALIRRANDFQWAVGAGEILNAYHSIDLG
jgi:alpha-1,3-rhamnosyl/mannosyltransferase